MVVITPLKLAATELVSEDIRSEPDRVPPTHSFRTAVLVGADAAALALAYALAGAAARLVDPAGWNEGSSGAGLLLLAFAALAVLCGLAARGNYDREAPRGGLGREAALLACGALLVTGFLHYLLGFEGGRLPLLVMAAATAAGLPAARAAARLLLRRSGALCHRVLLVGTGTAGRRAAGLLRQHRGEDCHVAAVLDASRLGPMRSGDWTALLRRHGASLVLLAPDQPRRDLLEWLVRDQVSFVVPGGEGLPLRGTAGAWMHDHDAALWSYRNNLRRPVNRAAKLAFDLLGAAVLVVALAPLLALIALLIKLDGGSVLYAHPRLGAGGRAFPCLKFRSMVLDGDAVLARVLADDPRAAAEWSATRKLRDDPRVTAIGRVLRQTSLDELPQLFNVLRLEMSLVGPRPIVTAEVPRYGEDIHLYYATRPGLTGLWQVSGRSDTGYGQRVRLDAWYVKNWSLLHDLLILARTVPAVLRRRGAV